MNFFTGAQKIATAVPEVLKVSVQLEGLANKYKVQDAYMQSDREKEIERKKERER